MKNSCSIIFGWCLLIASFESMATAKNAEEKILPADYARTVFLGDSITDGNTYPQLVRDAFMAGKLPAMVAINAGIGGDTAAGMHARLDRDVISKNPTLVTLSAGANDALHGVSAEAYEREVRGIVDELNLKHVAVILLTPNILGPKQREKGQKNLDAYELVLRKIAAEKHLRLAEVNQRQKQDELAGHPQLAADDLHPNWNGQTMIARALLDAMGYVDVAIPDHITNVALPGVIAEWRVKRLDAKEPAWTEESVSKIIPTADWERLTLPDTKPIPEFDASNRWVDDYRTLGASVSLRQQPAGSYVGFATVEAETAHIADFTTGAELEQIWLNGKQIYQNDWKHGYHIGRETVTGSLVKGENRVLIRTGPVFFLGVTDQ